MPHVVQHTLALGYSQPQQHTDPNHVSCRCHINEPLHLAVQKRCHRTELDHTLPNRLVYSHPLQLDSHQHSLFIHTIPNTKSSRSQPAEIGPRPLTHTPCSDISSLNPGHMFACAMQCTCRQVARLARIYSPAGPQEF